MTCEQVDKKVISAIAQQTDRQKFPLVKYYCKEVAAEFTMNFTDGQCDRRLLLNSLQTIAHVASSLFSVFTLLSATAYTSAR